MTMVRSLRNPRTIVLAAERNLERLSIENIRRGTVMTLELVERLVYAPE